MASIYKILYEVKLLHEYYLTDKNGSSIFDKPTQQGKINFLAEFFKLNRSTIASDLDFLLPEFSKEIFSNYQLRLIPSYSGFRVAIKVEPKKLSDNSTGFKPLVPFPDDLPLAIGLYKKNPSIDLFSNNRFNSEHTGIYFFTNRELGNPKSFPVLSEAIPSYSPGSRYEQGELTLDYSNNTQAFYLDENENEQWLPVSGSGFVNENDRMLVNKRFFYNFNQSDQVNQAEFKLKDKTGNEIKNLLIKNPAGIQKAQIDFSSENLFHSGYSLDGPYTLEITADNGFNKTHQLVFIDEEQSMRNCWAFICIYLRVASSSFNLLDDDGFIREKINPDNSKFKPDFFELRFKSRFTYWRYVNENKNKIKESPELNKFLNYDAVNGIYITGSLRNASRIATDFKSGNSSRFLPTPRSYDNIKIEKGRMITDVVVPKSTLFAIE